MGLCPNLFDKLMCQCRSNTDRIQHAGRGFHDALHRITGLRHACNTFNDHRTELVQIHEIDVLTAVAKCARCRHDGVSHLYPADIHAE